MIAKIAATATAVVVGGVLFAGTASAGTRYYTGTAYRPNLDAAVRIATERALAAAAEDGYRDGNCVERVEFYRYPPNPAKWFARAQAACDK